MPRTRKAKPEPSGDLIPIEDLDGLIPEVLLMETYCKSFREHIAHLVSLGYEFDNAGLEPKRPTTKWDDETEVERLIAKGKLLKKDEFLPRKLIPQGAFKSLLKDELKKVPVRPAVQAVLDHIRTESSGFNLVLRAHQKETE